MGADKRRRRRPVRQHLSPTTAPSAQRMAQAAGDFCMADVSVDATGTTARVHRMQDASPVDRMYSRGVLDERRYGAAMRFWSDWYHAGLIQRTTSTYSDSPWPRNQRTGMAASEIQVFARQRLRSARAVLGNHLARVAEAILIDELDPVDAGRRLFGRKDVPQARASATDVLKIALDTLADHYGL